MSEVTINIPRSTGSAKLSMAEDYLQEDLSGDFSDMHEYIREHKNRKRSLAFAAQRRREQTKKIVFTEKFVISNSNQPLQISLKNVAEPGLSVAEAKIEIQNAYDKGFGDGQEASNIVYQNEIEKYKEWINSIDNVTKELRTEFSKHIEHLQQQTIPIAAMIAKHILVNEVISNSEIVIEQVRKALKMVEEDTVLRISVNPSDIEILMNVKSTLTSDKSKLDKIEISGDSTISKGGCILSTSAGLIDASIEAQLKKVKETLIDLV